MQPFRLFPKPELINGEVYKLPYALKHCLLICNLLAHHYSCIFSVSCVIVKLGKKLNLLYTWNEYQLHCESLNSFSLALWQACFKVQDWWWVRPQLEGLVTAREFVSCSWGCSALLKFRIRTWLKLIIRTTRATVVLTQILRSWTPQRWLRSCKLVSSF